MNYPVYLNKETSKALEFEEISDDAAVYLSHLIDAELLNSSIGRNEFLYRKNRIINRSLCLKNESTYILEPDNMGDYLFEEFAWHDSKFCSVFRGLDASQFAELACACIQWEELTSEELNKLTEHEGLPFCFCEDKDGKPTVTLFDERMSLPDDEHFERTSSLALISKRMYNAFDEKDWGALRHACASFYESLLKNISREGIKTDNWTFDTFYKKQNSLAIRLPKELWNEMHAQYVKRHNYPNAGHGSRDVSEEDQFEMALLLEKTLANGRAIQKMWRSSKP